ncbi:hypothetical protein NQ317_003755 [Molorchus minor]|uniref:THAP-type domain-containing protein n=1 Tax=Molorchus minor TaxID=1323400 RepID=A0ABQ9JQW0_9CUCU|nr:hypothetical protein NQ317_003755 [Molorchus minor]
MGKSGCAIHNCQPNNTDARHRFPNPKKFPSLFLQWIKITNNIKLEGMEHVKILKNSRVCDKHFTTEDHSRNNRLKANAYPKLHIPLHHTPLSLPRPSSPHDISLSSESTSFCLSTTSGRGLLHNISNLKSCELTAMTKRMYQQAVYYKRIAGALNRKKLNLTEKLNFLEKNFEEEIIPKFN